jgi:hypothetical protein
MTSVLRRLTGQAAVCLLVLAAGHQAAHAARIRRIEVQGHLKNDGRFHVVEIHHIVVGKGSESDFRVFGLGADQSIVIKGITRISEDGGETPLVDQEVDGPDQYRYYPAGHVYYRYPVVTEDRTFRYRFEYELINAVAPAWGITAGWGPLTNEFGFGSPWERWRTLVMDFKEAWAGPERRYRLDHDVLLPEYVSELEIFEVDYDFAYDSAWREVNRDLPLGRATADVDYRVRRLLEYVAPGQPAAAAHREASLRFGSILAVIAIGPLCFLAIRLLEFATSGRGFNAQEVATCLAALTPEEVRARLNHESLQISLEKMLPRMAREKKLAIEVEQPRDDGQLSEVALQLLVPRESLPPLELALVNEIFADEGDFTTSGRVRQRFQQSQRHLTRAVKLLGPAPEQKRWVQLSLLVGPLLLVGMWHGFWPLFSLYNLDNNIAMLVVNAVALWLIGSWPKHWWHVGRPTGGLVIPLLLLVVLYAVPHFTINRPYAAEIWVGSAICILAYYLAQLINSRLPLDQHGRIVRDLVRVRDYARRELKGPTPRLEDRWIPHLLALGLKPEIVRWRADAKKMPVRSSRETFESSHSGYAGEPFTGRLPERFQGRPGWTDPFYYEFFL